MIRSAPRRVAGAFVLAMLLGPSACMVHEHRVGTGPVGVGSASARQFYFFFGYARLNDVDAQRLALGKSSFSVQTSYSFVDFLLAPLLLPLTMCSRSVTVQW